MSIAELEPGYFGEGIFDRVDITALDDPYFEREYELELGNSDEIVRKFALHDINIASQMRTEFDADHIKELS